MAKPVTQAEFRLLPSVEEVLKRAAGLLDRYPRPLVVSVVREILAEQRAAMAGGAAVSDGIERQIAERLENLFRPSLRAVINATGVVLHTNLGRAPLAPAALEAIRATGGGYSNLEYDLERGARGRRDVHAGGLLERILGAPSVVVNNNAAAMFLVLNELAAGGEVIISRGELIEIGDGFRIPDILTRSGARMVEVGTTNRTRIEDYRAAVTTGTRVLLRVHHSNFRIVGFTSRPSLEEMVELGRQAGLPVVEDLGSGCLVDLARYGLEHEPEVRESLAAGVDVVSFSGDKLLGGPQAGILTGNKECIARIRRNPLFRALRVDKLIYAALEATLREYLRDNLAGIPIFEMLGQSQAQIRERGAKLLASLDGWRGELRDGRSVAGGGSTPGMELPTALVALEPPPGVSLATLERRLRTGPTPVVARLENDRLVLDLRTVLPAEEPALVEMLRRAAHSA